MTGIEFEDKVEELLIKHNIVYKREGKRIEYGHKAGKGKFDFLIRKDTAIECKVIETQSLMTIPGLSKRTKKPRKSPKLKLHQLTNLRKFKDKGMLLVYVRQENRFYAITEPQIMDFISNNVWVSSLKGAMQQINLEEFIKEI